MKDIESGRLAAPCVWEKVLELLGNCREKKILDAPAGRGGLSKMIRGKGANVISLDLTPPLEDVPYWIQSDLNQNIPFRSGEFDGIVCVEGIEHVENPQFLVREMFRILKSHGTLVITTPNTLNLRSRIKFLFTGNLFWFGYNAI